jgi:hypothetical protein
MLSRGNAARIDASHGVSSLPPLPLTRGQGAPAAVTTLAPPDSPKPIVAGAMPIDADFVLAPSNSQLYGRYVKMCRQAGVDPAPPERVRDLLA